MANRLAAPRTYMTPPDSAGVAISSSPIELVAACWNIRPARITSISPSSFDIFPPAAAGEALNPLPTSGSRRR